MNTVVVESRISRVVEYKNTLGIFCVDDMFPGKTACFSTNINGEEMEKWKNRLQEGLMIKFKGNITEAKKGSYGAYVAVYNPEILEVYRLVPERIYSPEENNIDEKDDQQ